MSLLLYIPCSYVISTFAPHQPMALKIHPISNNKCKVVNLILQPLKLMQHNHFANFNVIKIPKQYFKFINKSEPIGKS